MNVSTRSNRYFQALATGYIATGLTMLVGLWLTPFSLRYLSREEFAIFTLATDVLLWFTLADLGLASSLRVMAARLTGDPDTSRMNKLASTAFLSELSIGLVVLLAGLGTAAAFPSLFDVPESLREDATGVVSILSLSVALHIGMQTFSALLVAHQQTHVDNALRVLLLAIRTGLTVTLLLYGWGLYSLAVASFSAEVVTIAIAYYRVRRSLVHLRIRPALAEYASLRELLGVGFWFTIGGLAGLFIEGMDRVVAAKVVGLESVTTLALTGRLYLLAYGLIGQVTDSARPALGQLLGQGDTSAVARAYQRLHLASTGLALAAGLGIWAGNVAFVRWWVGSENYGGIWLDTAFALNLLLNCWVLPNRATLAAGLIVRPQSLWRLAEGFVNFMASIALGTCFGLPGVVAGTAIACLLTSFWFLPPLTARLLKQPPRVTMGQNVGSLAAGGTLGIAAAAAIRHSITGEGGLQQAAWVMSVVAATTLGAIFILGTDHATRKELRKAAFRSLRGGGRAESC
jgi:O-antigen/teichoic acid export membrane protein